MNVKQVYVLHRNVSDIISNTNNKHKSKVASKLIVHKSLLSKLNPLLNDKE